MCFVLLELYVFMLLFFSFENVNTKYKRVLKSVLIIIFKHNAQNVMIQQEM